MIKGEASQCTKMIKLGRNGMQGSIWDESGKTQIVQVLISHQQNGINSIQFLYDLEEEAVLSESHGEPNGSNFSTIVIDRPFEFLTSISGEYDNGRLVSIVFGTNKAKYGPFGKTSGLPTSTEEFKYDFAPMCGNYQKCCFGGFHGSVYNGYVNAIGVYVMPLQLEKPLTMEELWDKRLEAIDEEYLR